MPFEYTPTPGSHSYELWKRRYKEDRINFFAFFISMLLVFASGIIALAFIWSPKRHLSQGYIAQPLPSVLYSWTNTFADGRANDTRTATCTADYWDHSSYVYYGCISSGSFDQLSFSLQSLTPYTSQRYRSRSVSPLLIRYWTSAGYASATAAAASSRAAAATAVLPSASPSAALQSGVAQATSTVNQIVVRHVTPTPAPKALNKRQSTYATTVYDHVNELSAGAVASTFPILPAQPTSIPIQTPKLSEGYSIFFTLVIAFGLALSAATLVMVLFNIKVARSKKEPPPGAQSTFSSTHFSSPDPVSQPLRTVTRLRPLHGETDSINGEPAPPYTEQPDAEKEKPSQLPSKEVSVLNSDSTKRGPSPARMSILDAYNLLPSYAVFGWWQMFSILMFKLEIVVWALLASFVAHLVTFIKDGGCIAPDSDYDLTTSICRIFWGVRPVIWSKLPGAMPVTVMQYGYPIVIALITMVVFFLAHLSIFIVLCRKSVLAVRHDVEPLNRDNSGRYVGITRAGYFCFLDTPGNHIPSGTHASDS